MPGQVKWDDANCIASIGRFLKLSCISLPRWSSQHIRTFAAAAHEHFHRLLEVGYIADRHIEREYDRTLVRLSGSDSVNDKGARKRLHIQVLGAFQPMFGADIIQLCLIRQTLIEEISTFFRHLAIPRIYVGDGGVASRDTSASYRQQLAERHANEFLADAGALVIAGPAFAFTYRTIYYAPTARQARTLESVNVLKRSLHEHPPWLVRISLMIGVLQHLGFHEVAQSLAAGIAADVQIANTLTIVREYLHRIPALLEILRVFAGNVAAIADNAVRNGSYDIHSRGVDERTAWSDWLHIADAVENNEKYLPNDLTDVRPSDLINAIWAKRIAARHQLPMHRLAWRMALRNSLRSSANPAT
jgi:hypothetical protein